MIDRRTFLQTTGAALAATSLVPLARGADDAPAKKRPLKKAVNLGMVKAGNSVLEKFQMVKDAGFDGIELNRPDAIPLDELLKARDATGLKVAGLICSTHWGKPLSSPDPAVVDAGVKGLRLALSDAAELGCERLLLVPGVVKRRCSMTIAGSARRRGSRRTWNTPKRRSAKSASRTSGTSSSSTR